MDMTATDAPIHLSAAEADAWAMGWNSAVEKAHADQRHFRDRRAHPCGCVTAFDLGAWESVGIVRCAAHTRPLSPSATTPDEPASPLPDAKGQEPA